MKRSKTKERDIKGLSTAPKSHVQLTKEAKEKPIVIKEQKYRMKVFLGKNKLPTEYTAHSREKLEQNKTRLKKRDVSNVLSFGEIEKIK